MTGVEERTGAMVVGDVERLATVRDTAFDRVTAEVDGYREPWQCGVVRRPDAVAVLPYDLKRGVAYLCRQPRVPLDAACTVEAPAGKMDVPGEAPVEAAARELQEEMGFEAASWLTVAEGVFVSPGYSNEQMWLFLAEGLVEVPKRACDGYIERVEVSLRGLVEVPLSSLSAYVSQYRSMIGADLKTLALLQALMAELAANNHERRH